MEGICHGNNPCLKRYRISGKPKGIAFAVNPLMVIKHYREDVAKDGKPLNYPSPYCCMLFDYLVLLWG